MDLLAWSPLVHSFQHSAIYHLATSARVHGRVASLARDPLRQMNIVVQNSTLNLFTGDREHQLRSLFSSARKEKTKTSGQAVTYSKVKVGGVGVIVADR